MGTFLNVNELIIRIVLRTVPGTQCKCCMIKELRGFIKKSLGPYFWEATDPFGAGESDGSSQKSACAHTRNPLHSYRCN